MDFVRNTPKENLAVVFRVDLVFFDVEVDVGRSLLLALAIEVLVACLPESIEVRLNRIKLALGRIVRIGEISEGESVVFLGARVILELETFGRDDRGALAVGSWHETTTNICYAGLIDTNLEITIATFTFVRSDFITDFFDILGAFTETCKRHWDFLGFFWGSLFWVSLVFYRLRSIVAGLNDIDNFIRLFFDLFLFWINEEAVGDLIYFIPCFYGIVNILFENIQRPGLLVEEFSRNEIAINLGGLRIVLKLQVRNSIFALLDVFTIGCTNDIHASSEVDLFLMLRDVFSHLPFESAEFENGLLLEEDCSVGVQEALLFERREERIEVFLDVSNLLVKRNSANILFNVTEEVVADGDVVMHYEFLVSCLGFLYRPEGLVCKPLFCIFDHILHASQKERINLRIDEVNEVSLFLSVELSERLVVEKDRRKIREEICELDVLGSDRAM
ncbi:ssDNA binding protein [Agrobacterium phage OLIVR5]|uniref:SsDNA binding protein n=1 Tax=Agrobacterium phage OLIVR5 TaxID=2723773 RepID=A0A858MTF2_9CAUD|nr:ssDNA binding protein [Agrobacterium phage OLIVR5]QIW87803.1 ssDNA binding protein [Agrobacterium phage OLIVR5]QIW88068.1 ssDNA binding protein [Agrobacterium phage OLIVR6]